MVANSAQMQGWRRTMQDENIMRLDIKPNLNLFAIFDGHGGLQVSIYVRQVFESIFMANLKQSIVQALRLTFIQIDQKLRTPIVKQQLKQITTKRGCYKQGDANNAGCTANVVIIDDKYIYCANIGDSRSVLCQHNQTVQLSKDHKPIDQQQYKRIKKAGGDVINGRVNGVINLSRAFGDLQFKNEDHSYQQQMVSCIPDIKVIKRSKEDKFILMGCDGIWQKYVHDSHGLILQIQQIGKNNLFDYLFQRLIAQNSLHQYGCDNMSAIIIQLK